jgi:hypothetical protein
VNTKNLPYRIYPKKMLQVLIVISKKFYCREEPCDYVKVIHKKEEKKKRIEKMDKCPRYLKQWVLLCPLEKNE